MSLTSLIMKIIANHTNRETGIPEVIVIGWTDTHVAEEHLARYLVAQKIAYGRVLDVASGSGYGSHILSRGRLVEYVISVDIDFNLLRYGKMVFNINAIQANAMNLPFRASSFDTVVSFETIEHLDNPALFLNQIRRVLKNGGLLILSTPNKFYTSPLVSKPLNPYHVTEFYLGELIKLLLNSGFKPLFILCGKPTSKITLIRRIVATLIKRLFKTLNLSPLILDQLYNSIFARSHRKKKNISVDPSPQRVVHNFIRLLSNYSSCEYFIVISKKRSFETFLV